MNLYPLAPSRNNVIAVLALSLVTGLQQIMAQSQPATIPTIVAQAMTFGPGLFGRPQFFDGRTPTDWPVALVPSTAKALGGGIIGDSAMFRMRVAVFEFSAQAKPRAVLEDMMTRAGYAPPDPAAFRSRTGGFAETPAATPPEGYCSGSTFATVSPVDSVRAPAVFAVFLLDGENGRQNCSRRRDDAQSHRFPATVPTLVAPSGVLSFGGGSSWSGSSGEMRSTLRTTMPTDSVLAHYSAQLVAGGWKAEGRAANANGIGVQRFSFREGQDAWTGALIVMAVGERREVLVQVSRAE